MIETLAELLDLGIDPKQAERMLECSHVMNETFSLSALVVDKKKIDFDILAKNIEKKSICAKCGYGFWK